MKPAALALLAASVLGFARLEPAESAGRPTLGRVAVLVLENRSYGQVIGNPRAPYLNSLARRGALATNYYAIAHPSLPNYVALTTGDHSGVNADCATCEADGESLVNQLDAAGLSWRAYFENRPLQIASPYVHGAGYNRYYNPFVYSETLGRADLAQDTTNFHGLSRDLAAHTLPRFSWIAPNIWHDGHTSKLAAADRFAARLVPPILQALGPRGVLFITWDEGRRSDHAGAQGPGGGHVALIALGPAARSRTRVAVRANHYALLKTIEKSLGLSTLGHASDDSTPVLSGLLKAY